MSIIIKRCLLFFLVIICVVAGASVSVAAAQPSDSIKIIRYQIEGFSVPQVRGMGDNLLQAKINSAVRAEISGRHDPTHYAPLSGEFEVSFYNGNLLGIHFVGITYTRRAAHPNKIDFGIHIDMTTGRIYELSDLFKASTDYKSHIQELCRTNEANYRLTSRGGRWWTWDGWTYEHFRSAWSGHRFLLDADSVRVYDSLNFATGYFGGYGIPYGDMVEIIDVESPLWRAIKSGRQIPIEVSPEEFSLDDFIVRTYDIKPGDQASWVVTVMGEPKAKTQVQDGIRYDYEDLEVTVNTDNKVSNIVTDKRNVSTRRWVQPGSSIKTVKERYGDAMVSSFGEYDLYEYAYKPYKTGTTFILRFAVKKGTEIVSYIGWRISEL